MWSLTGDTCKKSGFALLLLLLFFFYGGYGMLDDRPQSVHTWRQSDCLSISLNYHDQGMRFFHPEIHNRISDDFTSGYTAGEFPGLYYLVASLWKVFGVHEWIYRLLVSLLFAGGIWALFLLGRKLSHSWFAAMCIALTLYTSPVLFFYSVNFLTNVPALSLILISGYVLYLFYSGGRWGHLLLWSFLISLAGLLKIPALISVLALAGALLIAMVFRLPHPFKGKEWKIFLTLGASLLLVLAWYRYAADYNAQHGGKYTFNGLWPLWEASPERIQSTWTSIRELWFREYHYKWFIYASGLALLAALLSPRKLGWTAWFFLLFLVLGILLYGLLWFQALHDHDYYLINLFVLFPVVWFLLLKHVLYNHQLLKGSLNLLLLLLLILSANHVRGRMQDRYNGWWNTEHRECFSTLYTQEAINRELGIGEEELVIVPGDVSFNMSLYLMDQPGYTSYGMDYGKPETVERLLEKGAAYLFILPCKNPPLDGFIPYISDTLYTAENLTICKLR